MPKSVSKWNEAIEDAERLIREARERIAELRRSIRTFEELRDAGETFPGESQQKREAKA
jgi:hypothetical protein